MSELAMEWWVPQRPEEVFAAFEESFRQRRWYRARQDGLREAGAAPELVAQVEETLYTHLGRLPEETAKVLGAVLRAAARGASGWRRIGLPR